MCASIVSRQVACCVWTWYLHIRANLAKVLRFHRSSLLFSLWSIFKIYVQVDANYKKKEKKVKGGDKSKWRPEFDAFVRRMSTNSWREDEEELPYFWCPIVQSEVSCETLRSSPCPPDWWHSTMKRCTHTGPCQSPAERGGEKKTFVICLSVCTHTSNL